MEYLADTVTIIRYFSDSGKNAPASDEMIKLGLKFSA